MSNESQELSRELRRQSRNFLQQADYAAFRAYRDGSWGAPPPLYRPSSSVVEEFLRRGFISDATFAELTAAVDFNRPVTVPNCDPADRRWPTAAEVSAYGNLTASVTAIENPAAVSPAERIRGIATNVPLFDEDVSLTSTELQVIDSILEGQNAGPCSRSVTTGLFLPTDPPTWSPHSEPVADDRVSRPPSDVERRHQHLNECREAMRRQVQGLGLDRENERSLHRSIYAVTDRVLYLVGGRPDTRADTFRAIANYFQELAAIQPLAEETQRENTPAEATQESAVNLTLRERYFSESFLGATSRFFANYRSNNLDAGGDAVYGWGLPLFDLLRAAAVAAEVDSDPPPEPPDPEPLNSVPPDLNRRLSAGRRRLLNPFTVPAPREQRPG